MIHNEIDKEVTWYDSHQKDIVQWTLNTGVNFCRELEKELAPLGYHCAITGSTLYKGESKKDLDVIIYPHDSTKTDQDTFLNMVDMLDGHFGIEIQKIDRMKYPDEKDVYWGYDNGKRIDFFFLK